MTPAASVCIPTYNGERFIGQAVESVLSQTFADFELIIVDDASTDGTVARIEQFRDSRIKIIRNESNLGLAGNWNKAVGACCAPLIKLLCHDDLLYKDCLAEQVKAFTRSEIGIVSARRDVIDEAGRVWYYEVAAHRLVNLPVLKCCGRSCDRGRIRWESRAR